jgi:DUF4097 and DUF4098 domain-containing protein YvlB
MLKIARISAVALAGALALASPAVAQETETVNRTASIRAGGELRIKNFSGKVTITGSRRGDIAIHAVRRGSRERLDHIKLEVTETGSGVTIEANKKDSYWRDRDRENESDVVETQLDIQVPEDVQLDVNVFSSDVIVSNVTGSQRVKTFSGNIDLSGATGSVNAETFSGDIEIAIAQGYGGRVDFDSFSGSLRADGGMTTQSSSRRRTTGQVGTGGSNNYKFKTFSGDVRIR